MYYLSLLHFVIPCRCFCAYVLINLAGFYMWPCQKNKEKKYSIYVMKWVWNLERRHKRYTKMQWQVTVLVDWRASPPELHALSVHPCSIFQVSERFFCALRHPKHALKSSQPPPELLHVSDSSHWRLLYVPLTAELWFQCLSRGLRWQSDRGPELCCSWFHRESRTSAHTRVCLGACTNTGYTHLDRSLTSVIVQYFSVPRLKGLLCRTWNTQEHRHTPTHRPPLSLPAWVPSPSLCLF